MPCRKLLLASALVCMAIPVSAKGVRSGQYAIGNIQQICLKGDGTWYGTTFNFGGHWVNNPANIRDRAAIYGRYQLQGHEYEGYGNTAITFQKFGGGQIGADWYDWFDDFSYQAFIPGWGTTFVKSDCDPPFTGENTHAATQ